MAKKDLAKGAAPAQDAAKDEAFIEQEAQKATDTEPHGIRIDLRKYDPKLDPGNPDFDAEAAYKAAIEAAGGCEEIQKRLEKMQGLIANTAREMLTGVTAFLNSDGYKAIKERLQAFSAYMTEHREAFAELAGAAEETQKLIPFLQMEIDEHNRQNPNAEPLTIDDALSLMGIDGTPITEIDGEPLENPFIEIMQRAKERKAEHDAAADAIEEIEQAAEELPRIISNPTDKLNYPLDKPNSVIWNLITDAAKTNPNGQLKLAIDTSKKGSKQDAVILYSINFDELPTGVKITKQLTQFDKRCYIAAAALYNAGNEVITATQVYGIMGNSGKPKADQLKKINDTLTKMGAARVYIDNQQEVQAAKGYKHFKYDAPLLPFERISAYINGQLTESAIHLFREPPLISFARQRNQITTISRQLLESPINKTDANLRIDDYLLERIGHMKSGKGKAPRKMLFATIYKQCKITTAKQKQRAPEKIRRYLDHYKKCGWIKGYTEDADGITILL